MSKLVRTAKHPAKDLYLNCYTKRAYYKKEWNEETINARGHVRDGMGNLLSCPFPKLHNLDEVEWASREELIDRLEDHADQIIITKKYNGHLAILFNDGEEWINTTKGSFINDFIELDRLLMEESGFTDEVLDHVPESWTLMFEIVADYDQHLMTHRHVEELKGERAVLIGVNDRNTGKSVPYDDISILFETLNVWIPYVDHPISADAMATLSGFHLYKHIDWNGFIDHLFNQEETEGFVLHDMTDDFRVKVKTKWFIKNRYLYQFGADKTRKIFSEHFNGPSAYDIIPEELHDQYNEILDWYDRYLDASYYSIMETLQTVFAELKTKEITFEWVDNNPDITPNEREVLKLYADGADEETMEAKLRSVFCDKFDGFSLVENI